MSRPLRLSLVMVAAAVVSGCWFSGPTRRFDPSRPDSVERNLPDKPETGTDPNSDRIERTPVPEVPALQGDRYTPPAHFVKATRKGFTIACRPAMKPKHVVASCSCKKKPHPDDHGEWTCDASQ